MTKNIVIAIDGPAGAGKSTIAKNLAQKLNISYLDTGAMYRALTLKALRMKINLEDESALTALAHKTTIDLEDKGQGLHVSLDGQDVSEEIRTLEVTNNTFYIARAPKVREIMVRLQQEIGAKKAIVAEGRDTTTVVFPKANYKFYLDADVEERALRRLKELAEKGKKVGLEQMIKEVIDRDQKDFTRSVGPLKKASDAITIDSSGKTAPEVAEIILQYIKQ